MNDIDTLMQRVSDKVKQGLDLVDEDIDGIIAWHRQRRAQPKVKIEEEKMEVSTLRSMMKIAAPVRSELTDFKRRV